MSLSTTEQIKQFEIGIIISRNFDNGEILDRNLGPHLEQISHIHSTAPEPGGALLERFARDNAIPFTIWPTRQHAFVSVNKVLEHSKFVYIITDNESKIAKMAEEECKKKTIKHKIIQYDPTECWRIKICQIEEIIDASLENKDETIQAIQHIL